MSKHAVSGSLAAVWNCRLLIDLVRLLYTVRAWALRYMTVPHIGMLPISPYIMAALCRRATLTVLTLDIRKPDLVSVVFTIL